MATYDADGPFNDPIVRCCDCQTMIFRTTLQKQGCCPKCGIRRVKNVLTLSSEEIDKLNKKGVDPAFIALFEPSQSDDD